MKRREDGWCAAFLITSEGRFVSGNWSVFHEGEKKRRRRSDTHFHFHASPKLRQTRFIDEERGEREKERIWAVKRSIHSPWNTWTEKLSRRVINASRMNGDTWRGWMGRPVIIHPRWRINVRENFKAEFPIFHARGSKFFNSSKLESREARDSTLSVNQTFSSPISRGILHTRIVNARFSLLRRINRLSIDFFFLGNIYWTS